MNNLPWPHNCAPRVHAGERKRSTDASLPRRYEFDEHALGPDASLFVGLDDLVGPRATTTSSASRTSWATGCRSASTISSPTSVPREYPNRRRLKIYAHAELTELKDDTYLAWRLVAFLQS